MHRTCHFLCTAFICSSFYTFYLQVILRNQREKNRKKRIVIFVGSPVCTTPEEVWTHKSCLRTKTVMNVTFSYSFFFFSAHSTCYTIEDRESACGYCELWAICELHTLHFCYIKLITLAVTFSLMLSRWKTMGS